MLRLKKRQKVGILISAIPATSVNVTGSRKCVNEYVNIFSIAEFSLWSVPVSNDFVITRYYLERLNC